MYIGQQPVVGRYIKVDQISGGFNGTASGFTLAAGGQGVLPGTARNLMLSLGGVIQEPETDFTVSGSGITFTTPPVSGTTFFCVVFGDMQAVGTPSDGTVLPASISTSGTFVFPNVTVSGTTVIASGTAAAPSLAVSGDLNTGLYSPGADQLAISTGGSGRLFVDASGRVGVGTSSPGVILDIRETATGATTAISLFNTDNTNSTSQTARIGLSPDSRGAALTGLEAYKENSDFSTSAARDVSLALNVLLNNAKSEAVRITSAGKVGIGTSAPSVTFEVVSATDNTEYMRVGPLSSASTRSLRFSAEASSGGTANTTHIINAPSTAGFLKFQTNSTTAVTIDSSQRVGIGTTGPGRKLAVTDDSGADTALALTCSANTRSFIQYASSATNVYAGNDGGSFVVWPGASEKLRVDTSGRLLVGTSTANGNYTLQIQGDAAASTSYGSIYLRRGLNTASIGANVGAGLGQIVFGANDGTTAALIECTSDAAWSSTSDTPGRLVFSTTADGAASPTEQMRIDSAGRVVIGESANNDALVSIRPKATTPSYNLYCDAIAQYSGLYRFVRFRVTASNTIVGSIESNGTSTTYATTSDYRLKENVTKISNATSRLQQLKPSRFNFIADPDRIVDGFIAHEVQTVVPEAIVGTKDEKDTDGNPVYQGIDQSKLVPLLTAALQEAVAKIEALEARLTAAGI